MSATVTAACQALTKHLAAVQYSFICPSPETQARVVGKRSSHASTQDARNAEDFFGWNLSCAAQTLHDMLPDPLIQSLLDASIIVASGGQYRAQIRVSNFHLPAVPSLDTNAAPLYYIHSSFPPSPDAVFFGPDTYLFIGLLRTATRHIGTAPNSMVDVCCGSGAGAIHMKRAYPQAKAYGLDLNARALALAHINAQLAGVDVEFCKSDLYAAVQETLPSCGIDLIVSNPPYIASSTDAHHLPVYADGGADLGLDMSIRIVGEGAKLLSSRGIMVVYTGVAMPTAAPGHDAFLEGVRSVAGVELVEYTVLHPDMWPEEIGRGAYAHVGRIQTVGAVLRKRREEQSC